MLLLLVIPSLSVLDVYKRQACTLDLPLGQYYVKELKAPAGFVSSDEVLNLDASYQGQDLSLIHI